MQEAIGKSRVELDLSGSLGEVETPRWTAAAVVRLTAQETPEGLMYQGQTLRVGGSFTINTATYHAVGEITEIRAAR